MSQVKTGDSEAEENSTTTLPLPDVYKINRREIDFNIGLQIDNLSNGTFTQKKDAITSLFNLSILPENIAKIVQAGSVKHLLQLLNPAFGLDDEATALLARLAAVDEGRNEIVEKDGIPILVDIVASGSERAKENAVDALMKICRSSSRNCRLVVQGVIIPPLLDLTQFGTVGAKEKAQTLLDYFKSQGAYTRTHPELPLGRTEEDVVTVVDSFGSPPPAYSSRNIFWPSSNLLDGENRSLYLSIGVPLYNASLNGDWESAKKLIDENYSTGTRNLLCCSITNRYETALHVAAGARQAGFVEELLKLLEPTDLTLQDRMGNTAFCLAAAAGAVPITKMMMEKNPDLLYTPTTANITPLYIAANFGHRNMAWFLYHQTMDRIQNLEGIFFRCIDTGLFDLALELLRKDERLAVARNEYDETALHLLARKPSIFSSKNSGTVRGLKRLLHLLARKLSIFSSNNCGTLKRLKRLVIKSNKNADLGCEDHKGKMPNNSLELVRCIFKHILNEPFLDIAKLINHPTRLLFEASRMGNYIFLAELIRMYPELIWEVNDVNQTIFHIAVLNRHINIFNQIHKIGSIKDEIVTYESNHGDNILHLAAKIPSSDRLNIVSGAALQMHQELLWFKEVKRITPFLLREKIGSEGLTPRELFIKEHKDLHSDGEKWMKNTARSCMIVATLITTVVFASAFRIPGGNNDTGTPIQIKKTLFHVFAVSDAMALSSSIISTLMFLYILTSRYAEEDFLESLPFKLMVGLATLFISMIAMMVAFMAAFFLAYHHRKLRWVPFLSSSFLFVPVSLFVMLLSPLFRDIFQACWGSPFRSGGSESKQAGTMIPQERVNRPPPPQEKYSDCFEHQQNIQII